METSISTHVPLFAALMPMLSCFVYNRSATISSVRRLYGVPLSVKMKSNAVSSVKLLDTWWSLPCSNLSGSALEILPFSHSCSTRFVHSAHPSPTDMSRPYRLPVVIHRGSRHGGTVAAYCNVVFVSYLQQKSACTPAYVRVAGLNRQYLLWCNLE